MRGHVIVWWLAICVGNADLNVGQAGSTRAPSSFLEYGSNLTDFKYLSNITEEVNVSIKSRVKRFLFGKKKTADDGESIWDKAKLAKDFSKQFWDTPDTFPWRIQEDLDLLMATMHYSFVMNETDNINLPCENSVIRNIKKKYPKSLFRWRHNGKPIEVDSSRMVFYKGTLVIRNLQLYDTGVYTCQLEYKTGSRKTVAIFSVLVMTDEVNMWVKQGRPMKLNCNSQYIMHPKATREWIFNHAVFDNLSWNKTNASLATLDVVPDVKINYNGTWLCRVTNPIPEKVWFTAIYNVMVLPPPPLYEVALIYALGHKANTLFIALVTFCVLFAFIAVLAYHGRKIQDRRALKRERMMERIKTLSLKRGKSTPEVYYSEEEASQTGSQNGSYEYSRTPVTQTVPFDKRTAKKKPRTARV